MSVLFAAVVPAVLLLVRRQAAMVMLATIAATWAAATLALCWLAPDDIFLLIMLLLVGLPAIIVSTSIAVSTALAPRPRKVFDAGFLAMCGWWLGFVFMIFAPEPSASDLWTCAQVVAFPAIFAASGAAFGATNPRT